MIKLSSPWVFGGAMALAFGLACLMVMSTPNTAPAQPAAAEAAPEPAPPTGQVYTGAKRCSSCHFKQAASWKKTKHSNAYNELPEKHRADPECMKCHVTAYGVEGGYTGGATPELLQGLLGVTCEACHGPGSKHEEVCKPFLNVKKLSPEQEKVARDSIYKILPGNICAKCHLAIVHQEHPKYEGMKEKK
ncbi:MAG: cytochrome c family protein [Thermoguttaceae bacterium]|jgi:hypothetical protein|nr:cytochrome c family protein [Thermoguttaceae bacterium]